ncbi:MAG: hypothetical protein AAF802_26875 [Planctomycetota bacterium]
MKPSRGFTVMELLLTLSVLSAVSIVVIPNLIGRQNQAAIETTRRSLETIRRVIVSDYRGDVHERLPYPVVGTRIQHPQLKYLFHNPEAELAGGSNSLALSLQWSYDGQSGRGWAGPYLDHSSTATVSYRVDATRGFLQAYGEDPDVATGLDDPAPSDAWGNPIILQQPAVVSGGGVHSAINIVHARLVSAGPDGEIDTPLNVLNPTAQELDDDLVVYLRSR